MINKKEIGLYIHIPFCKSKCFYCDFNSFAGKEELVPQYFEALKKELEQYQQKLRDYRIKTLFIGGGTPSVVETNYIVDLMNHCKSKLCIENLAEITIETNPGTLSCEKLVAYRDLGINRLSMGLQAWQNHLLHKIGRIHSQEDFLTNYSQARKVGFENINIDLIFGLPGQTLTEWEETLRKVMELQPEHISCYSLKIEEGTVFGKCLDSGELRPVEDELDREMYYLAKKILNSENFQHYEISNFAKPGFECFHNLNYWGPREYLGLGAGAHSYLEGKRFNTIYSMEEYIHTDFKKGLPIENVEELDKKGRMSEFMILRLRLLQGFKMDEFYALFHEDLFQVYGTEINELIKRQLLEVHKGMLRLTSQGLDFANQAFMAFV